MARPKIKRIGLVASPGSVNGSSVAAPAPFERRNISLHPAQNRRVSHDNSAFGHHLDKISGAQFETQVPPDTKHDDVLIEMSSFEKIKVGRGCGHLAIIAVPRSVSSFAPEPSVTLDFFEDRH